MAESVRKRLSKAREFLGTPAKKDVKEKKKNDQDGPILDVPQDRARFWWFTVLFLGMAMMVLGTLTCVDPAAVRFRAHTVLIVAGSVTAFSGLACVSMYFHRWGRL